MTKFTVPEEEEAVTVGMEGSKWQTLTRRRKRREVVGGVTQTGSRQGFPVSKSYPLHLPNEHHQLGAPYSNSEVSGVRFSFRPPRGDTETSETSPHPQGPYRMAELLCSLHTK